MGILTGLQTDPLGTVIRLLYILPAILIALTLHEMAHGYVALKCGDPTAQMLGRLSFNPLRHLDPVGTLFMVLFGFGWARPVPVNPRNFKNYRRDDLLVSVAGVVMNFCLFLLAMLLMTGLNELIWDKSIWSSNVPLFTRRSFLGFEGYNFYAVSSGDKWLYTSIAADGVFYSENAYYMYLKTPWLLYVQRFVMGFARINLGLALFNLLPIPPLDGYHVVNDIFLRGKLHIPANVVRVFSLGLMAVLFFTDIVDNVLWQAISFIQGGVLTGILTVLGLG